VEEEAMVEDGGAVRRPEEKATTEVEAEDEQEKLFCSLCFILSALNNKVDAMNESSSFSLSTYGFVAILPASIPLLWNVYI
jgi:hypothetical protein